MAKLPVVSGLEAVKAFARAGWRVHHPHGSHVYLVKLGTRVRLSVPEHRELKPGLLRGLIRDAGLTPEEFLDLL
jgi:predicted RNA binding protein YcfA (HicA-like mRNA interferase family)